ncbi:hypothetical protein BST61_g5190 [Cercospora zeina]
MEASRPQILLAYRHLYQHLLRAVQFAKPQRYVARDRLRNAFRSSERQQFNAKEIERTLEFLREVPWEICHQCEMRMPQQDVLLSPRLTRPYAS